MANPLHSVDHWTWLFYDACEGCATHAAETQQTTFGFDYWEAIDGVEVPAQLYTAVYCYTHDQGALILGNHTDIPVNVRPCGAKPARGCDYTYRGILKVQGGSAKSVDFDLSFDYDRHYAGGWEVKYFAEEVYTPSGIQVKAPPALAELLNQPPPHSEQQQNPTP
jgi:hypothetical protein